MSREFLLKITSVTCGFCAKFEPHWPAIRADIQAKNPIEIRELVVKKFPLGPEWPESLSPWIGWFPMFMAIEEDSWNAALKNPRIQLKARVFDGEFKNGKMVKNGKRPLNSAALVGWLQSKGNPVLEGEVEMAKIPVADYCGRGGIFSKKYSFTK